MSDPRDDLVERNIERLVRVAASPLPESRTREAFQGFLQQAAASQPRKWHRLLPIAAAILFALLVVMLARPIHDAGPGGRAAQGTASPEEIRRWIGELGSDEFATRERATEKLRSLGMAAQAALVAALEKSGDAEVRSRVLALLRPLEIAAARELACGGSDGRILLQTASGAPRRSVGPVRPSGRTFRCVWSPDGRWLAYFAGLDLHVLEILTEVDHVLAVSIGVPPVWSPDSAWLAFRGSMEGAVLAKVGDWSIRRLDHPGTPCGWSPDGTSLYLNNIGPGVVRYDLKSGQATPLVDSTAFAFATDGAKLYYLGKSDGQESYRTATYPLMKYDLQSGKQSTLVSFIPQGGLGRMALSPGGRKLAFTKTPPTTLEERERSGELLRTILCIVDTDGSDEKVVGPMGSLAGPSWSPDGTRLAFERDGKTVIYWVDSGQERTLEGLSPAWCPMPPIK